MSQIKYCAKCGDQLLPNAKFCATCGAPVSALPVQVAPTAPAKRRPWFSIIAVVMIVLAFLGGASIAPERIVTTTTTYESRVTVTRTIAVSPTAITTGVQRIGIGQTLNLLGRDNVPVEVTFTKVRYDMKVGWDTADKGYKFVIVDVTVKNVGNKETAVFSFLGSYGWTVKVDKGYVYKAESDTLPSSLRAEDVKPGYVYFEILQDTTAIEMYAKLSYPSIDLIVEL